MNKILICTVLTLLLCISVKAQEGIVLDEVIAVIGNEIATKSELETKYASFLAQGGAASDDLKCEILEDIFYSKMLLNQAELDSVEIGEGRVDSELDRRIRYYITQHGSEQAMESYYKKSISKIKDEFRESLREQLTIQTMQSEIGAGLSVTPEEVRSYFKKIPKDSLPLMNAEVEIAQIVVNTKTSPEAIREVKGKLNNYRKRVNEGEKFSTLAVLYSEDKGSALKGGEIGFVGKAEVEPEFSAAAFKLKEGNVSSIIKTRYGYHIIQLIERRGAKVNVRHILLKAKQDQASFAEAKGKLDSISNLIEEGKYSFEEAARKFSENEETTKNGGIMVNPQNGSSMTAMDDLDPSLFFVIDNMEVNDISKSVLLVILELSLVIELLN
ncbi:MAG: peptidylprolyl isomerase [Flavobacteriales bacterium]|nr:peptidylprolyl isomerase [Flavobacteriales bacterium]